MGPKPIYRVRHLHVRVPLLVLKLTVRARRLKDSPSFHCSLLSSMPSTDRTSELRSVVQEKLAVLPATKRRKLSRPSPRGRPDGSTEGQDALRKEFIGESYTIVSECRATLWKSELTELKVVEPHHSPLPHARQHPKALP